MPKRRSTVEDLAKSRVARVTGMGAGGLQAMSIGLVLGGCVAAGYMIGAWLDNRFRTGFWMPVGVFLGMAAGFREMFLTLKRISALTKWPGASSHDPNVQSNEVQPNDEANGAIETSAASVIESRGRTQVASVEPAPRKRLFEVPEPPRPSFERDERIATTAAQPLRVDEATNADEVADADVPQDQGAASDTLRELLGAEKYAELQAELEALKENASNEETGDTSPYDRKKPQ